MRTFLTIVLGLIAGCIAFLAMGLTLVWWTAGSAGNLSSTVVSIIDSPGGAAAIGSALMDDALSSASPAAQAALEKRRPELEAAAGKALTGASEAVGKVVAVAFTAVSDGIRADLDLRPIVLPVLAAMHQVDPAIPSTADGTMSVTLDGSTISAAGTALRVLALWWVAALLALGLLVATGFASRHAGWRRWRPAGIALLVPALLWVLISSATLAAPMPSDADALVRNFIEAAIGVIRLKGLVIALIAGAIAAVLIGISFARTTKAAPVAPGVAAEPSPSGEAAG
ncbi:MAG: hypothetical protein KGP12_10880 [Actinomycetales bacterium]|nr:hypothetical protein [Actinomycetales bacterium]